MSQNQSNKSLPVTIYPRQKIHPLMPGKNFKWYRFELVDMGDIDKEKYHPYSYQIKLCEYTPTSEYLDITKDQVYLLNSITGKQHIAWLDNRNGEYSETVEEALVKYEENDNHWHIRDFEIKIEQYKNYLKEAIEIANQHYQDS